MRIKQLLLVVAAIVAVLPASAELSYSWNPSTKTLTVSGKGYLGYNWYTEVEGVEDNKTVEVVIIGKDVEVGYQAFQEATALRTVTFESGYTPTTINDQAFSDCSALTSITLPNSITKIGRCAFSGCTSLTAITIPHSVKTIVERAFGYCSSLNTVYLGKRVESIGICAFENCPNITSVTATGGTPPTCNKNIFDNAVYASATLYTYNYISDWYRYAEPWSNFTNRESMPNYVGTKFSAVNAQGKTIWYCTQLGDDVEVVSKDYPSDYYSGYEILEGCSWTGEKNFYEGDVVIPETVTYGGKTYTVSGIGSYAFHHCATLTSVTIPNTVETIGVGSFVRCSLPSIVIPNSVTTLGEEAFADCSDLKDVTVGSGVTGFRGAFKGCNLNTFTILATTPPTIDDSSFEYASGLTPVINTTLIVPRGSIDAYTAAEVWKFFRTIMECYYDFAAENADGVMFYYNKKSSSTVETICEKDPLLMSASATSAYVGDVTIPETVTHDGTTYDVTGIGAKTFHDCTGLTSITIPESITQIGDNAFTGCTALATITVQGNTPPTGNENMFDAATYSSATLKVDINYQSAFADASPWKKFTHVETFGEIYTFYDFAVANTDGVTIYYKLAKSTSLVTDIVEVVGKDDPYDVLVGESGRTDYTGVINVPATVTYDGVTYTVIAIGEDAFWACKGVTAVTIPNGVELIGGGAFDECTALTSITIPASVTELQPCFYRCNSLTSIVVDAGNTIYDSRGGCNAIIEKGKGDEGKLVAGCVATVIPSTVETIGFGAFAGMSAMTSVNIPEGVKTIESYAFIQCSGLTTLTVPNSVTTIEPDAFSECSGLTSVTLGEGLESIGEDAFYDCSAITSVTVLATAPPTVQSGGGGLIHAPALGSKKGWRSRTSRRTAAIEGIDPGSELTIFVPVFTSEVYENATLTVPYGSLAAYQADNMWKQFKKIEETSAEQCATPTITLENGTFRFSCETPDVEYEYVVELKSTAPATGSSYTYAPQPMTISVKAKKEGFRNSNIASMDFEFQKGDTNYDGTVSITDAVAVVNIILNGGTTTAPALEPEPLAPAQTPE